MLITVLAYHVQKHLVKYSALLASSIDNVIQWPRPIQRRMKQATTVRIATIFTKRKW
jgi:hypothetical protein